VCGPRRRQFGHTKMEGEVGDLTNKANEVDAALSCSLHLPPTPDSRIDQVVQSFGPILIEVLQNVVLLDRAVAIAKREL
jgi:hypothetical protein